MAINHKEQGGPPAAPAIEKRSKTGKYFQRQCLNEVLG